MKSKEREEYFTPQRRFSDSISSSQTILLDEDMEIFGKTLRAGSVLHIVAWRDIEGIPYLIVSKDSWESLLLFEKVRHLLQ